jgi:hypothetical protein
MASRAEKIRRRQQRKDKKRRRPQGTVGEEHVAWGAGSLPASQPLPVPSATGFKMSEALFAVLGPALDTWRDEEDLRKLLLLGIAAWNIALEKGAERTARMEELMQSMPPETRDDFRMVLQPFIARRDLLFPHVDRFILDYTLEWHGPNKPYVQVIYTFNN